MQTLPFLVAEMRALGVRRLELELEAEPVVMPTDASDRDTESPPAEPKPDGACAFDNCQQAREGLFGGSVGSMFCRQHALEAAGVKT
jgi:hypothetical protein